MARKEDKEKLQSRALMAGLLGSVPATFLGGLMTRLSQGKGAKVMFAGPKITETQADVFSQKAFKKDPLVEYIKDAMPSSGRSVRLPVVGKKEQVPLPAAAHEFSHAAGGPTQKITSFLRKALFMRPATRVPGTKSTFVRSPAISPLHIPLMLAAATPKEKDEKGVVGFAKSHPALLASVLAAGPLAGEAHASAKALRAIKKVHGRGAMMKSAPVLGRAFAATASSYLPAVATIWGTAKIRDWLQKRMEKKAGEFRSLLPSLGSTFPGYHGRLKEIGPVNTRKPRGESERKVDPHHEE
jgi:hypothetical protein